MHLVIGANGRVGRHVTEQLITAGEKPRILVRDAKKAINRFGDQVTILVGDLDNRTSLDLAMRNVQSVFLCTPVNPGQVKQHNLVADSVAEANAYLVKVSGLATFPGSFVDSGRWHAETEAYIRSKEIASAFLHPFFFMQNMDRQIADIRSNGILRSPVTKAAIAMVDIIDIAAVATNLMLSPNDVIGKTLPLTTNQALTYEEMAEEMTLVFGRSVSFQEQVDDEVTMTLRNSGMPEWHARIILQFNRAFNEGYGSEVHSSVEDILNRPPKSFRDYLKTASASLRDNHLFPN